jgi:alpha-methylacyl-CoA racemase
LLVAKLGPAAGGLERAQFDIANWPAHKARLAELFRTKTRAEWCALLEGTDVCFAPVLSLAEAAAHPHNRAREAWVERDGLTQPSPAPRFSATPGVIGGAPTAAGAHTRAILESAGYTAEEIDSLTASGVA